MPKEILLYGDIYSYSAASIITQMNEIGNSDLVLRVNSDGGEVRYGWGILAKLNELKGKKTLKNDGCANSMSAFAFFYNKDGINEGIDTCSFSLHRAGYSASVESNPDMFTDVDKKELQAKNDKLRAAMEARIDVKKFEAIKNVTLDRLFSLDERIEVTLNCDEAIECKVLDHKINITPERKLEIEAKKYEIMAQFSAPKIAAQTSTTNNIMNIDELKSKHPDVYKAVYAKGFKRGTEKEFDRTGSILAYLDADPKGVMEAFKSGKPASETQKSEWSIKSASAMMMEKIEGENPGAIPVDKKLAVAKTEAEKVEASFKAELFEKLNIKTTS